MSTQRTVDAAVGEYIQTILDLQNRLCKTAMGAMVLTERIEELEATNKELLEKINRLITKEPT